MTVQGLALARNLLVARLIGPEQFGVAAVFILISQFLDLTSDVGLNKFILAHRSGQRAPVQASVHFVSLWRGVALSVLMLIVSWPVLHLLGRSPNGFAVAILAVLPIAIGALHYDNARLQQRGQFLNDVSSQVAGELVATASAITLAWMTHSYLAVVAGLTARAIGQTITSHVLAERKYQVRLSRRIRPELTRYSLPLMLNGFVLFCSMQSDRALVAIAFSPTELGVYAACFQLLSAGSTVLTKTIGTTFLPQLAAEYHESRRGRTSSRKIMELASLLHMALVTGFAALSSWVVPTVFGSKFHLTPIVGALIAVVQGIRLARVWPSTVALATAHTRQVLMGNIARLAGLPLAIGLLALGAGMEGVLIGYAAGEFFALALAVLQLKASSRERLRQAVCLSGIALVSVSVPLLFKFVSPNYFFTLSCCLVTVSAGVLFTTLRTLRM